jgi:hypothetical protein
MADIPGTLTGVGALLVAVFGAVGPAAAAGGLVVTGPTAPLVPVGSSTTIGGASVTGFGPGSLRLVITVSSGVLGLPAATPETTVTTPAGYPELGATGPQLAIEGEESVVNHALADLSWAPTVPGPAEVTLEVTPAGVEYTDPPAEGAPIMGRGSSTLYAARPPSAPPIGDASAGVGYALVHWQVSATDERAPVLGYVVSGDPGGWCAVPATQTFCVLRGLTADTGYTFRVAAISEVGLGAWSEPSTSVVPTARSSEPVNATVVPPPTDAPAPDPAAEDTTSPEPEVDTADPAPANRDAESPPPAVAPAIEPAPAAAPVPATDVATPTADPTTVTPAPDSAPVVDEAAEGAKRAAAGEPALTVVFDVGPGADLADAQFTVRGKHLSPGTSVQVVAYSEPVLIGAAEIAADGTLRWVSQLPPALVDGDHRLVASAVGHDGSVVERTMAFTTESGRLVRIGASSLETTGPTVPPTAPPAASADAAVAAPAESSGGGIPRRAVALLVLLAAVAILWWRARSRRIADPNLAPPSPATTDSSAGARSGPSTAAADGSGTRRRQRASSGERRRSRRQTTRSA